MKTIVRIAALSGTLFVSGLVCGQETAPAPAAGKSTVEAPPATAVKPRPADGWQSIPLGMLIKQVELTPEQAELGKQLNSKYMKSYQGLGQTMAMEERTVKVKELMDAREKELVAILTPEQQEKYGSMRAPNGEVKGDKKVPADSKTAPIPAPAEKKAVK